MRHGMAKALVVHKEKSLGVRDRPTKRGAEIVLHQVIVAHGIERTGIERAIAQELVGGAMEFAGARAGHNVDLSAARATHLCGVASRLYFEFLHRIGRRAKVQGVERRVCIGGAIEQIVVRVGSVAANANRGALSGPPIQGVHVAGLGAVTLMRAGNSEHQVNQHSAVERKFLDGYRFDHLTQGGVRGMERWGLGADFHYILGSGHLQREIQRQLLAHFKLQISG